jgi:hypothetical protein
MSVDSTEETPLHTCGCGASVAVLGTGTLLHYSTALHIYEE